MTQLDWIYKRKNCDSCQKAEAFLAEKSIGWKDTADARKERIPPEAALQLLSKVDEIFAAKGAKVLHFDLKHERPSDDEIIALIIGPSGNLRAPTLIKDKKMVVGFNADMYSRVLG